MFAVLVGIGVLSVLALYWFCRLMTAFLAVEIDEYRVLEIMRLADWVKISDLETRMRNFQNKPRCWAERVFWPARIRLRYHVRRMVRMGYLNKWPLKKPVISVGSDHSPEYRITAKGRRRFMEIKQGYLVGSPVAKSGH